MICLLCGEPQKKPGVEKCDACKSEFALVPGLFGYNNISQLIHALDLFRKGEIGAEEVQERFGNFLTAWESFSEKWGLQEQSVPEAFNLKRDLDAVYGGLLNDLEEAMGPLNDALDKVEELTDDSRDVDDIEEAVRHFCRRVCSTSAAMFTKLESRGGDFDSLLENFGAF